MQGALKELATSEDNWGSTSWSSSRSRCGAHLRVVPSNGEEARVLTLPLPSIMATLAFHVCRLGLLPSLQKALV